MAATRRTTASIALLVSTSLFALAEAQGPPAGLAVPAEVRRDPSGDYVVTYPSGGGSRTFTIVPATKIEPLIDSAVDVVVWPTQFRYSYRVGNGAKAAQGLHSITMSIQALAEHGQPPSWMPVRTPQTSRMTWLKIPGAGGLRPGDAEDGFWLTSGMLPGPAEVRCSGDVEPPKLPLDIPPAVNEYLHRTLVLRNHVIAWAITPSVSPGLNEPELTSEVLTSRVRAAYAFALGRSSHPARHEILAVLDEAVLTLANGNKAGTNALNRALSLAQRPVTSHWDESLGKALAICISYIKYRFGIA